MTIVEQKTAITGGVDAHSEVRTMRAMRRPSPAERTLLPRIPRPGRQRRPPYLINCIARTPTAEGFEANRAWARGTRDSMARFGAGQM
jgi:hypothetical protein